MVRILRVREGKALSLGHTARKGWDGDFKCKRWVCYSIQVTDPVIPSIPQSLRPKIVTCLRSSNWRMAELLIHVLLSTCFGQAWVQRVVSKQIKIPVLMKRTS
jgi:hypothetical protein